MGAAFQIISFSIGKAEIGKELSFDSSFPIGIQ